MAVDTRSRRASVLGVAFPINLTPPLADGVIGTEDRGHLAYCYAGIAASAPSVINWMTATFVAASASATFVPASASATFAANSGLATFVPRE